MSEESTDYDYLSVTREAEGWSVFLSNRKGDAIHSRVSSAAGLKAEVASMLSKLTKLTPAKATPKRKKYLTTTNNNKA